MKREAEQKREEKIRRYTDEIIEYARKWSDARDRHVQDPVKYPMPKPENIPLPKIIESVKPWTDEEFEADTKKFINTPTQLHKLKVFSQFVNSETHNLVKYSSYPLFCIQQAYNSADAGPVHDMASKILENDTKTITILHNKSSLPLFNPHPVTLRILEGHTGSVSEVSMTPDGRLAVSGSYDKTLRVWDVESGQCLRILEGHTGSVYAVSLTPDGRLAVSGSNDKTLRVWDVESGRCLRTLEGHTGWVDAVSLTPDGRRAVSGPNSMDKTLRVRDVESGRCLRTLEGHTGWVTAISLSPDGRRAVSGSNDETLRVWDVESGQCLRTMEEYKEVVLSVSLSPDGRRAVSGSWDNTLRVWDVESGLCLRTLEGHTSSVNAVSLTPDGRRAVSGSDDRMLRVWDMESGQCLGMIALSAPISEIAIKYPQIIVGLSFGEVHFLEIQRLKIGKPIITPIRRWLCGKEKKQGRWDDNFTALCEWCVKRFVVSGEILDVINSINRTARLSPDDSPCLKLPDEAFNDPRLISACPHCHQPLKFNPFVVDNRERY